MSPAAEALAESALEEKLSQEAPVESIISGANSSTIDWISPL